MILFDWVKFIYDDSDPSIFDSSISKEHSEVQDHKMVDPGTITFIATILQLPYDELDDSQQRAFFLSVMSSNAVIVNALLLVSTVLSLVHVKIVLRTFTLDPGQQRTSARGVLCWLAHTQRMR